MSNMFCFQCEQTAKGVGCQGSSGVCGKQADTAGLQDELIGALVGLAYAANDAEPTDDTHRVMIEGLFTTITNVSFDNEAVKKQIEKTEKEIDKLVSRCGDYSSQCSRSYSYNVSELWTSDEDIRSLKSLILFGLKGMAAYAYHALVLGYSDKEVNQFFYKGMRAVGLEETDTATLLPVVLETGQVNLKCMALLDKANTETYGTPEPTKVSLTI